MERRYTTLCTKVPSWFKEVVLEEAALEGATPSALIRELLLEWLRGRGVKVEPPREWDDAATAQEFLERVRRGEVAGSWQA